MTKMFYDLIVLGVGGIIALLVLLIIRATRKKTILMVVIGLTICTMVTILLVVLGLNLSPSCDHPITTTSETIPATCLEQGKTPKYCVICKEDISEYEDALGHSMKEVSLVEPTISSEGEKISRCKRCDYEETEVLPKLEAPNPEENPTNWKKVFSSNGFAEDEIAEYEEILTNVGITDYHDVEIYESGIMHIVRGKIFDSNVLQLNITLENRKIIVVTLAGIPYYETNAYINWRGELKFKTEQSKRSIDLYYDVEGGYVAKLDWDNMLLTPYNEE